MESVEYDHVMGQVVENEHADGSILSGVEWHIQQCEAYLNSSDMQSLVQPKLLPGPVASDAIAAAAVNSPSSDSSPSPGPAIPMIEEPKNNTMIHQSQLYPKEELVYNTDALLRASMQAAQLTTPHMNIEPQLQSQPQPESTPGPITVNVPSNDDVSVEFIRSVQADHAKYGNEVTRLQRDALVHSILRTQSPGHSTTVSPSKRHPHIHAPQPQMDTVSQQSTREEEDDEETEADQAEHEDDADDVDTDEVVRTGGELEDFPQYCSLEHVPTAGDLPVYSMSSESHYQARRLSYCSPLRRQQDVDRVKEELNTHVTTFHPKVGENTTELAGNAYRRCSIAAASVSPDAAKKVCDRDVVTRLNAWKQVADVKLIRAQQQRQSDQDEKCTFHPEIHTVDLGHEFDEAADAVACSNKKQSLTRRQSTMADRLVIYQDAQLRQRVRLQAKLEAEASKELTFKPEISAVSRRLKSKEVGPPLHERVGAIQKSKHTRLALLKAKQARSQAKKTRRKPKINPVSDRLASEKLQSVDVVTRLSTLGVAHQLESHIQRQLSKLQQESQHSFHPTTNTQSETILKKSQRYKHAYQTTDVVERQRVLDNENVSGNAVHRRKAQVDEPTFQPKLSAGSQAIAEASEFVQERYQGTAAERWEKLSKRDEQHKQARRRQAAARHYSQYAFRPKLSKVSRQLAKSRSLSNLIENSASKANRAAIKAQAAKRFSRECTFTPKTTWRQHVQRKQSSPVRPNSACSVRTSSISSVYECLACGATSKASQHERDAFDTCLICGYEQVRPTDDESNQSMSKVRTSLDDFSLNIQETDTLLHRIRAQERSKEARVAQAKLKQEVDQMQQCTFYPSLCRTPPRQPSGAVCVRGLDNFLRRKEMLEQQKEQHAERENQVFLLHCVGRDMREVDAERNDPASVARTGASSSAEQKGDIEKSGEVSMLKERIGEESMVLDESFAAHQHPLSWSTVPHFREFVELPVPQDANADSDDAEGLKNPGARKVQSASQSRTPTRPHRPQAKVGLATKPAPFNLSFQRQQPKETNTHTFKCGNEAASASKYDFAHRPKTNHTRRRSRINKILASPV
jgi:hypothetical protein